MININFKIIHNKFSRLFKFIFFIRYLFVIFLISIVVFLSIPNFFDYQKKEKFLKNFLFQNYNLKVEKIDNIKFNSLPMPNLELSNINSNFGSKKIFVSTKKMKIYPKLQNIYNYKNFKARNIILEDSKAITDFKDTTSFAKDFFNFEKKILLKNFNILVKNNDKVILDLKKIKYTNYGFEKDKIIGEIFDKNFIIKLNNSSKQLNLKLLNSGISAKINIFDNEKLRSINGEMTGKVLDSNYKFKFNYDKKSIKIVDFFLREKDLSLDGEGLITIKPYFNINWNSEIININAEKISQLDLEKLLSYKDLLKKINSQINLYYQSKKFSKNLIDKINLKTDIAYGRLNISKLLLISDAILNCKSNINLIEDYPILNFECDMKSPDKKKLLKKIQIDYKKKKEVLNLNVKGNLNILNKKINFDSIKMNENYIASEEDLKYFKKTFETIVFNQHFFKIFDLVKIKQLVREIL